jgi:phosphonate degradation associated HDIG domain protein
VKSALILPLLRSPAFWLVCALSLGLTLLREAFNNWTPTYFAEGLGLSQADAAGASALFPLFGGLSVLLAGLLGDRLGRAGRAWIILVGLAFAGLGLLALGPGDFGGKQGGGTASGFIDSAGYLGGALAGWGLARASLALGWRGVFFILAGIAWASAAVASVYLLAQRRAAPDRRKPIGLMTMMTPILFDRIARLFSERGDSAYFGEEVSQSEHALQSACLAEREGASDELVVAALLHDIGHLVNGHDEDIADRGLDGRHEDSGVAWLSAAFGPAVLEPIRLHVGAKRYLCAVDPSYRDALSEASRQSLALQGGPFEAAAVAAFEANPHHREAIRLRYWDDAAKVPGLIVPSLEHYRDRIEAAAREEVER